MFWMFNFSDIENKNRSSLPVILLEVIFESWSNKLKLFDLSSKLGNMQSPQSSSAIWVQYLQVIPTYFHQ